MSLHEPAQQFRSLLILWIACQRSKTDRSAAKRQYISQGAARWRHTGSSLLLFLLENVPFFSKNQIQQSVQVVVRVEFQLERALVRRCHLYADVSLEISAQSVFH